MQEVPVGPLSVGPRFPPASTRYTSKRECVQLASVRRNPDMPEVVDDKSQHCIPFILEHIKQHRERYEQKRQTVPPFFLGLNGVQGAGKTTLVGERVVSTIHCLSPIRFPNGQMQTVS